MASLEGLSVGDIILVEKSDYLGWPSDKFVPYPILKVGKKYVTVHRVIKRDGKTVNEFDEHYAIKNGRRRSNSPYHFFYAKPLKKGTGRE